MTICMLGELGEYANILKKLERGSLELNEESFADMAMELTDVFIYLCNAAMIMNIDLAQAYHYKRKVNEQRFGRPGPDSGGVEDVPGEQSDDRR